MRILVISDTHGNLTKAEKVCKYYESVDLLLHCGDYKSDAESIIKWNNLQIPVVSVKGNSDDNGQHYEEEYEIIDTPAGKLLLTHGHVEWVHFNCDKLTALVKEQNCIGACYGHTHVPDCRFEEGIWLINPGSLSEPRDHTNGSFALLNIEEGSFEPEIIYYDDFLEDYNDKFPPKPPTPPQKKKVKGGFLRGLLNYSDRF